MKSTTPAQAGPHALGRASAPFFAPPGHRYSPANNSLTIAATASWGLTEGTKGFMVNNIAGVAELADAPG